MNRDFLKPVLFVIFAAGVLWLGYMYVNDQKYIAFSECYQNFEKNISYDNVSTPVTASTYPFLCDLILTHKIAIYFTPIPLSSIGQ